MRENREKASKVKIDAKNHENELILQVAVVQDVRWYYVYGGDFSVCNVYVICS